MIRARWAGSVFAMVSSATLVINAQSAVTPAPTAGATTVAVSTSTSTPTVSSDSTSATSASAKSKTPAPPTTTRAAVAKALAADRARQATADRRPNSDGMQFRRDALGNPVPDVRAAAAIVFNPQTGEVVWEENSHDQRSIASLTKMMTAITFMADKPDLDRQVVVTRSDVTNASVTYLHSGDHITLNDVLHLTLIASDNAAARVLARTSEGGTAAFVGRMNEKAREFGLTNTHYADPTGLNSDDMSTAYDLSQIISRAAADDHLAPIMRTAEYEVHAGSRVFTIHSTNKLLGTAVDVLAGKTGFISKAGYCLATLLQIPQGSQVAVVVLGAADSATRFAEAKNLFNWVVAKGQGLVGGGVPQPVRR